MDYRPVSANRKTTQVQQVAACNVYNHGLTSNTETDTSQ